MLKMGLTQLKEPVTVLLQKQKQAQTTVADTYASIAAKKAGHLMKGGNGAGAWQVTSKGTVLTSSQKFVGGNQMAWWPKIKREKVPLKSTTPGAILSALKKLTTVGKQVTIKHKHRKMDSGHTRWWFVLRGEEEVLTQLEGELEHVRLQLQWNTQITSYHDLPRPSSIIQNTVTIWLEQQIH